MHITNNSMLAHFRHALKKKGSYLIKMHGGKQLLFFAALKKIKKRGYFGHSVQYTKGQELAQSKLPFLELAM